MEKKMLYEIGDGSGVFNVDEVIEIPNGHFLIVVQDDIIFPPIRRKYVKLNSEDINGFNDDLFGDTVQARLFIGKDYDKFSFDIESAPVTLADGTEIVYNATVKANVEFTCPEHTLALFLENEDPSDSDIFIDTYTNECSIRALIEEEIESTLCEQAFFDQDTGEIVYENLDANHLEFMDYISNIESNIEMFFTELGMNIQIEIEDLVTVID